MATILNEFEFVDVIVSRGDGQPQVFGKLIQTDNHGILVRAEAETDDQIKEKIAVYVPHKEITMIHAREDENTHSKGYMSHNKLFGGNV